MTHDPYCGKEIEEIEDAETIIIDGQTCYFCSAQCKYRFAEERQRARLRAEQPAGGQG